MAGPGKILRPTSGFNAPRNVNTSGRRNQPFRYVRPMGPNNPDEDTVNCTTRYYDADGVELWHKNHRATVRDVAIDSAGNVYEVGDAYGAITLRKRDPDGVLLWTAGHGATLNRCVVAPDGGVVAGGIAGTGGYTLRKWDTDGNLEWSATTAGTVISLAVDSLGAVAALESLEVDPWDSLVYAFAPNGTPGETQSFGGSSGSTKLTPTSVAFWFDNAAPYTGTFAQLIAYALFAEGFTPPSAWRWHTQQGFGTTTGLNLPSGELNAGRVRELIADQRTTAPFIFIGYVAATTGAFGFHPGGIGGGSADNHDDIGPGSNANCMGANNTGAAFVGTNHFTKYPFRTPGVYWTTAEWSHDHGNPILGCDANDAGFSVMGGGVSPI